VTDYEVEGSRRFVVLLVIRHLLKRLASPCLFSQRLLDLELLRSFLRRRLF
jgi:hypothetical protein